MLTQKQYMHNAFIHASIIVKKRYTDKLNIGLSITMANKQQEKIVYCHDKQLRIIMITESIYDKRLY